MEFRNDDLETVNVLTRELTGVLDRSRDKSNKIEELLSKLMSMRNIKFDKLSRNKEESSSNGDKESDIERLKNENLQLMVEIQRQQYISKKWDSIIQQNDEILRMMTVWIKNFSKQQEEAEQIISSSTRTSETVLRKSIDGLKQQIKASEDQISRFEDMISEVQNSLYNVDIDSLSNQYKELQQIKRKLERPANH